MACAGAGGDADGDGHSSIACGGDDCDDDDANRFPGNLEICDGDHHDEDCDTMSFGGLDHDALHRVASMLDRRHYDAGEAVFKEGDRGASMFVVEAGELLATQAGPSGRRVRIMRLGRGDFFGETTLIEMHPRPYTVCAERETVLHELTSMGLYRLYQADVKAYVLILQNINRELCRRLRGAGNRLAQVADASGDEVTQIHIRPALIRPDDDES